MNNENNEKSIFDNTPSVTIVSGEQVPTLEVTISVDANGQIDPISMEYNSYRNDLNKIYLENGTLHVQTMDRGFAWLDTGTHDSLRDASTFVAMIQKRQGQQVACVEEIAYRMGYINQEALVALAQPYLKSDYGQYFLN